MAGIVQVARPDPFAFDVDVLEYAGLRAMDDAAALLARHVHQRTRGPDDDLGLHRAMQTRSGRLAIRRDVDDVVLAEAVRGHAADGWVDVCAGRVEEQGCEFLVRAGIQMPDVRLSQRANRVQILEHREARQSVTVSGCAGRRRRAGGRQRR